MACPLVFLHLGHFPFTTLEKSFRKARVATSGPDPWGVTPIRGKRHPLLRDWFFVGWRFQGLGPHRDLGLAREAVACRCVAVVEPNGEPSNGLGTSGGLLTRHWLSDSEAFA